MVPSVASDSLEILKAVLDIYLLFFIPVCSLRISGNHLISVSFHIATTTTNNIKKFNFNSKLSSYFTCETCITLSPSQFLFSPSYILFVYPLLDHRTTEPHFICFLDEFFLLKSIFPFVIFIF